MTSLLIAIITAVAAVVGSFVTWKISKRNTSGAIDTSVAADLWAEGGKIRGELRTDLAETKQQLDETNSSLREAVAAVTVLNDDVRLARKETAEAREESRLSRQETRELKTQIEKLTLQVTELHQAQIKALEKQTTNLTEQTNELHNEVKTSNSLTIGGLADNAESRRILDLPKQERTDQEQEHLRSASDRLPPELAADQTKDTKAS